MAVTIASKVGKAPAKAKSKSATESHIDRLNTLAEMIHDAKSKLAPLMAQVKPLTDVLSKLEAEAIKIADAHYSSEDEVVFGTDHMYRASAKGNSTTLTEMPKIQQKLDSIEQGLFMQLASIGITDLRKYLSEDEMEEVSVTKRTSKRRITAI